MTTTAEEVKSEGVIARQQTEEKNRENNEAAVIYELIKIEIAFNSNRLKNSFLPGKTGKIQAWDALVKEIRQAEILLTSNNKFVTLKGKDLLTRLGEIIGEWEREHLSVIDKPRGYCLFFCSGQEVLTTSHIALDRVKEKLKAFRCINEDAAKTILEPLKNELERLRKKVPFFRNTNEIKSLQNLIDQIEAALEQGGNNARISSVLPLLEGYIKNRTQKSCWFFGCRERSLGVVKEVNRMLECRLDDTNRDSVTILSAF